jgi:transcriptional regulator with XRE-family HTH domain
MPKRKHPLSKQRAAIMSDNFARRLMRAREAKGWSQSDLARLVWGTEKNSDGYIVAKSRGRISAYENGDATPTKNNLAALAKALGMTPEELGPELVSEEIAGSTQQAISMTMVQDQPDKVHLLVNVLTSLEVASKVVGLLSTDITTPVGRTGKRGA